VGIRKDPTITVRFLLMRDVIDRPIYGSYEAVRFYPPSGPEYTSTVSNICGWYKAARSEGYSSNGISATAYRAYRIRVDPNKADLIKATSRKVLTYKGERKMPSLGYCLQYIDATTGIPWVPPSVSTDARNALLRRIQNQRSNLLVAVGELKETYQTIASAVAAALRALAALRKGNVRRAGRIIREAVRKGRFGRAARTAFGRRGVNGKKLSDRYLAYAYGWRPLISEVQGLLEIADKGLDKPDLCKETVAVVEQFPYFPEQLGDLTRTGSWECGSEYSVMYSVKDPHLMKASALGLTNPIHGAWNLISLSFVIDWFLSVGSFLQGIGATIGLKFQGGYHTDFVRSQQCKVEDYWLPYDGTQPSWDVDAFAFKRQPLLTWPNPGLSYSLDLNLNQLVSAIALIRQRA